MGMVTCISGIDTGIGKTIVTGLMAKVLSQHGNSVITQKVAQTGCHGIAEDIVIHRKLMGIDLLPADLSGLTCPYVFHKACSPHLAAELENKTIDLRRITEATEELVGKFDHVLLEGVGGLQVPLTRELTFLDYIQQRGYPLVLVTSPRLGSINHTLSALELACSRGIRVKGMVYNGYEGGDAEIAADSRNVFLLALEKYGFPAKIVNLESIKDHALAEDRFSCQQFF